ncbi:glycoside hydrolase family 172 protein [Bacteroidota bacterium]
MRTLQKILFLSLLFLVCIFTHQFIAQNNNPNPQINFSQDMNELLESGAVPQRYSAIPRLTKGEWNTLFETEGPGLITHIWMTFPFRDSLLGRRNLIRIYWDDEEEPSVTAPLTDYFGIPLGHTGYEFPLNSYYLVITPNNGLNSYFKMPFAKKAKFEIFPDQIESGAGFYIQVDYYKFPDQLPEDYKDLRFHAAFRFENPCEKYGKNYLFLDAVGKGIFLGVTFGVEMHYPQPDNWVHGGGDSFFIDGEKNPALLHGIGAEDFFGHSWGEGLQQFQSLSVGVPYKQFDEDGILQKLAFYRFFVHDPVPFHSSIRGVLGALGNNYSSVAYWYQTEPHTPFFNVPGSTERMPNSIAHRGTYDIKSGSERTWKILAPFRIDEENPFEKERALESSETGEEEFLYETRGIPTMPGGDTVNVNWTNQTAYHNFVDFNEIARPPIRYIALPIRVLGYASYYEECSEYKEVIAFLGFDDEASVRINDEIVFHGSHQNGFKEVSIPVKLKKGKNRILIKQSNYDNATWRAWVFSFRIEDK